MEDPICIARCKNTNTYVLQTNQQDLQVYPENILGEMGRATNTWQNARSNQHRVMPPLNHLTDTCESEIQKSGHRIMTPTNCSGGSHQGIQKMVAELQATILADGIG
ncbi:hypothetical protein CDAR_274521 [Caerostris darwini]|uniref:Uncharacterized protein n=1 Tax=Caerostris darwini TaxID=1538125 RepID=A0AAV4RGD7_9ARAC|nr:hypothetical protein CDAR_274521 [Caerostris darwini]